MASTKSKKVLIVDDDKFLLDMYAVKFEKNAYDVTVMLSAEEALNKIKEGYTPDIIVTDIIMPGTDGFEFLAALEKENLIPKAKKVVLSNKGEREDVERGEQLGVDGYIVKASAIPSEVVAKVEEILNT